MKYSFMLLCLTLIGLINGYDSYDDCFEYEYELFQ